MDKLFEIWTSGAVEPQVFEGSEHSSCPKGSKVIFAYKCQKGKVRKLSEGDDVVIELTRQSSFSEGVMGLTKKCEVPEFYSQDPIPLKECKVFIDESDMKRIARTAEFSGEMDGQERSSGNGRELQQFLVWLLGKAHLLNPIYGRRGLLGFRQKY